MFSTFCTLLLWPKFTLSSRKASVLILLWYHLIIINIFEGPSTQSYIGSTDDSCILWFEEGSQRVSYTGLLWYQPRHLPARRSPNWNRSTSLTYGIRALSTMSMHIWCLGCKESPRTACVLLTLTHIIKFAQHLTKRPKVLFLFWREKKKI